ncbi:MAG: transposase [Flavobacteriales bacterium]|nr:transposase [Flavobacteriales bacterium]
MLTGTIGRLLSAAFEGEMDAHLDQEKKRSNRRNGYTDKTVRTALGPVSVRPPRDRNGSFEPTIIKKWDWSLAPELRGTGDPASVRQGHQLRGHWGPSKEDVRGELLPSFISLDHRPGVRGDRDMAQPPAGRGVRGHLSRCGPLQGPGE